MAGGLKLWIPSSPPCENCLPSIAIIFSVGKGQNQLIWKNDTGCYAAKSLNSFWKRICPKRGQIDLAAVVGRSIRKATLTPCAEEDVSAYQKIGMCFFQAEGWWYCVTGETIHMVKFRLFLLYFFLWKSQVLLNKKSVAQIKLHNI